jgi:predicted acyl esterase
MDLESRSAFVLSILASVVLGAYLGSEHYAKTQGAPHDYDAIDAMIPMRDGVKLETPRELYLRAGAKLSFEAPADGDDAFDAYVSDPANPVPYRKRPIGPTYQPPEEWPTWLVQDQRFVDHRPDVLTWSTDVLDHDLVIAGDIVADLFASTTGTDAD